MTEVTGFSIIANNIEKLKSLAEEFGRTITFHELGGIRYRFTISPDITAGQRTVLQNVLNAAGDATISTP